MTDVHSLLRKIRLRQLRCFVEVAQRSSFVNAAEAMGLTQPAVSRSVRELEQVLGVELFDRSQRGAVLTPAGESLLRSGEEGLSRISLGLQVAADPDAVREPVSIGALPNVCAQFLPGVAAEFKRRYPTIPLRIITGGNTELLNKLRINEVALVLGRISSGEEMRGLAFEHLYDEPLVFLVRPVHPLAQEAILTADQITQYPLILPRPETIIRVEAERFLASQGIAKIENLIETIAFEFIRTYLRDTDCIGVAPRGVFQRDLADGSLVELRFGQNKLLGAVGLTTRPDDEMTESQRELMAIIRNAGPP